LFQPPYLCGGGRWLRWARDLGDRGDVVVVDAVCDWLSLILIL
jgi:hypothetical protein